MEIALVSQFMEITACESQAYAVRKLSSCQWNLEKAVNLFFSAGGVVPGPSDAAPSPSIEEEKQQEEVRAPIPTRVERLCDDSYYGGSSRTDRAAWSMWDAPSPKPVPAVPMQGLSPSEMQASGWGVAEPDNGDDAEEEKFNGIQEAHDDVQEDDHGSIGGYGMGSVEEQEQDGEDKQGEEVDIVNYNEYEEEQDNASDNESEMEDYGLEVDEDYGYHDSLLEYEEEQPRPPAARPELLAEMYRLPHELMFRGTFHYAKVHAAMQDRFLLVNLQAKDFASCLQNRDLWANDVVSQVVKDNFVFQLLTKLNDYGDEGTKVCTFYKVPDDQLPALLVLDPITGQMLSRMSGAIEPDEFMLFIDKYTNSKPSQQSRPKIVPKTAAVAEGSETAATAGGEQEQAVPETSASPGAGGEEQEQESVPMVEEAPAEMVDSDDEPMGGEKMYKLRVRFPNGSVVPKEFGCQRRVSKLFAFCRQLAVRDAGKTEQMAFRIMRLASRAFEELENNGATFEELGLNFATVSVVFVT